MGYILLVRHLIRACVARTLLSAALEVGPVWDRHAQRNRRFHSSANMRTAMPTTIPINRARLLFPVIVST